MTRVQIDDLKGFAGAVGFAVRRDGMSVEDAITKVAKPHVISPIGCSRDGDTIQIRDIESGNSVHFVLSDAGALWVSATHRNGARVNQEQFAWLATELRPWLNAGEES